MTPDPVAPHGARRALVIVNPVSGRGTVSAVLEVLEREAVAADVALEVRTTAGEGEARTWAREAEGFWRVIAVGGDGTVMEAIGGLTEAASPIPLAQVPTGTANVLAMAVGVPRRPEAAARLAFGGTAVPFDVGYLPQHDRHFALAVSVGWHAQLVGDATRPLKRSMGWGAYVWTGLKNAFPLRRRLIELEIDGQPQRIAAHTLMVANVGGLAGAPAPVRRGVSAHDGRLDVAVVTPRSVGGMAMLLVRWLARGLSRRRDVRAHAAARVRIDADPPLEVQVDGEPLGLTPVDVEVLSGGVRLVVSEDYARRHQLADDDAVAASDMA